MDLQHLCDETISVIKKVAAFIQAESSKFSARDIITKDQNSFVTYVDVNAEKMLVEHLENLLPGSGFVTEEETTPQDKEQSLTWIIDPLDGTTNFLYGLPCYSISVALRKGEETVMGIVYEPNRDECFYSWKGAAAFRNGKPIKVGEQKQLSECLLATGFPYTDFSAMDNYLVMFRHLLQNCRGLRRWGSAAVDLCYTACGRFDGFFEYSLNAWDVAAGAFIVKQAGGKACDFSGGNDFLYGKQILAGNQAIASELQQLAKTYFKN